MNMSEAAEYRLFSAEEMKEAISHILKYSKVVNRAGRGDNDSYNDLIIAADPETSKTRTEE